jgi:hypothetical protein
MAKPKIAPYGITVPRVPYPARPPATHAGVVKQLLKWNNRPEAIKSLKAMAEAGVPEAKAALKRVAETPWTKAQQARAKECIAAILKLDRSDACPTLKAMADAGMPGAAAALKKLKPTKAELQSVATEEDTERAYQKLWDQNMPPQ